MKVLLVNGSPVKKGNTNIALEEMARTFEAMGIETEIYWIGNRPIRMCIDCQWCKRTNSGRCRFDDDVANELLQKVEEADGLVFGSPVFYGQPNGGLLSLIQRMMYSNAKAFYHKPTANVAVCRRGGATAAFQTMNMAFQMVNTYLVGSQYWNIVYGETKGEAAHDREGLQTMRTLARNMGWLLQKIGNATDRPEMEPTYEKYNFIRLNEEQGAEKSLGEK
jgi:multimeric flavodoxin WrbA